MPCADPRVKQVIGRLEMQNVMEVPQEGEDHGKSASILGITHPQDFLTQNLKLDAGKWFNGDTGDVAVIDQMTSKQLNLAPGDTLTLPSLGKRLRLKVVGVVHKPTMMAEHHHTVYVPIRTLQSFTDFTGKVSRVLVELKPEQDAERFADEWTKKAADIQPSLRIRSAAESKKKMDSELQSIHLLSYLGGIVSMAAATFIVFSALSMGVMERQRTLAMLRAVGAFRGQIARLVLLEGILLASFGAVVGVILGWLWVTLLAWRFRDFFVAGVVVSPGGVALGVVGSLLAALAASLLPAWSASRVSPLEAMSPQSSPTSTSTPIVCAIVGALLICIDPFLFFGPLQPFLGAFHVPPASVLSVRLYLHFGIGLPGLLLGFFLLSPLFVKVIETAAGPLVARLFGIRFALLRQQLSSGVWRAAGTATALMIGLATLIVLQVQGHSALSGWQLPDKFPDIFIASYSLGGIKAEDIPKLDAVPGLKPGEIMPVAIALPGLSKGFFGLAQAMIMPDATMFFGVDPDRAFKLMGLDFREGNAEDAARALKLGRHILITNEFRKNKGLHLGSKMTLIGNDGPIEYTVCGVIWSPGIDVIGSIYDMGMQMDQRTAASVFGSLEDARRDFGVDRYRLVAANLQMGVDKAVVLKEVQKTLREQGMSVGDVREIKEKIEHSFRNMLMLVSTIAFAAMAVASLGVTNTIMASVRSRRWQFGVLRSIGVTRGTLLRIVLAEAALLGLIACALEAPPALSSPSMLTPCPE